MRKRADICQKCGETRGAIRDNGLICWDGYDELGRHRFAPIPVDACPDPWPPLPGDQS